MDTNILVYCFEASQPEKKDISLALVSTALDNGKGIISLQVVQEFLNVSTRKFSQPIIAMDARLYLEKVIQPLCYVFPVIEIYHSSLKIQQQSGYSFYDSHTIAAALAGACNILYSEDLQQSQLIDGMKIINPYIT